MHIKAVIIVLLALFLNVGTAMKEDVIGEYYPDNCSNCATLFNGEDLFGRGYPIKYYEQSAERSEPEKLNSTDYVVVGNVNVLNFLLNWLAWIVIVGVGLFIIKLALEIAGAIGITILIIAYLTGYLKLIELF